MTGFLIDEMFPPTAAALLREKYSRDAFHVGEAGLLAADDAQVAAVARSEGRAVVTENADFATERDLVLVFVLKRHQPVGGAQAPALAELLDRWARANPHPYLGAHWPAAR